jgi:anti-sigma regulatory factor (Ser/Thr protein kinase)
VTIVQHDLPFHGLACDLCGQWEVGRDGVLEPGTWASAVAGDVHLCARCLIDGPETLEARGMRVRARARTLLDESRAVRAEAVQARRARKARSSLTIELPADVTSVAVARRLVGSFAAGEDLSPIDLALLTSELVTNAVRHSGLGPDELMSLRARLGVRHLTVAVHDRGPGVTSAPHPPEPDALDGRGLMIIEAVARAWGSEPGVVWFAL